MNKPLVYIVLVNYNGIQDTLECIDSLLRIDYPHYRIVVVDNGSHNAEAEEIKRAYPSCSVLSIQPNQGFGEGDNAGIRYALAEGAEYVLSLNNDTIVVRDFLSVLVQYAQHNLHVGAFVPKVLYYHEDKIWFNGAKIYWWLGLFRHVERLLPNSVSQLRTEHETEYANGCCLLIRRDVLERVGLLDPLYFLTFDDVDWSLRARALGYRLIVVPQAVIRHKISATLGTQGSQNISESTAFYTARNAVRIGRKYFTGIHKVLFLIGQCTFRLALNMVFCSTMRARVFYMRGLAEGFSERISVHDDAVHNQKPISYSLHVVP
jgi:GT2 family glycosyltransferase